jgi:hypothetical protein
MLLNYGMLLFAMAPKNTNMIKTVAVLQTIYAYSIIFATSICIYIVYRLVQ